MLWEQRERASHQIRLIRLIPERQMGVQMREEIGDRKRAFWAGGPMKKHRHKKGWQSVGPAKSSTWL